MLQLSIQNPCTELLENTKRAKEREKMQENGIEPTCEPCRYPALSEKKTKFKETGGNKMFKISITRYTFIHI